MNYIDGELFVMGRTPACDPAVFDLSLGCEVLCVSNHCHILTLQPHLVLIVQKVRVLMLWQGGCPYAIALPSPECALFSQVLAAYITY
jgi:hypothetical protein